LEKRVLILGKIENRLQNEKARFIVRWNGPFGYLVENVSSLISGRVLR
jgi:hypothetical protein